jgi:phosphoglycolate phosphatase-like HAD superfamily hydrolase
VRALVLDFDGVIADSSRETFAVARRTYLELRPDSPLTSRSADDVYRDFLAAMPLGNRAEDYAVVLGAIEREADLADQAAYDRLHAAEEATWLARYHERYYRVRSDLAREDLASWLGLVPPYRFFVELLRRRAGEREYAMATSRDRRSVDALLEHYGIADLFPADRILDKETGARKTAHLTELRERLGLPFSDLTFVDDKVNHLDATASLGVRCALAAWGYNGARERDQARERGYLVCTEPDAERVLFGPSDRWHNRALERSRS